MKEEKDIIEGNKLIALFMEGIIVENVVDDKGNCLFDMGKSRLQNEQFWNSKSLKYHKSFDWLMPVLQKIEKYAIIEINYALVVTCRICYLGKNKNDKAINFYGDNNGGREPIEAIWDCVVEFLKFYNENKPS